MRILQLTNKIPYPPKDGGAIATLNLSKGLAQSGHQIDILGMNTSKHFVDLKDIPDDLKNHINIYEVRVDTDISVWDAFKNLLFSNQPYNAERFFHEGYKQALIDILRKQTYHIIQLEGLYMAYYIDVIRLHSKAKISLRAHNIEHEIWERTAAQEKSVLRKWYFKVLARRIRAFKLKVLNKYDLLIPITNRDAGQFQDYGNIKPYQVVPAGYDLTSAMTPQSDKIQFPTVFFIGTLDWFPNQEGLVWFLEKVWLKLLKRNPGIKFHVAGRNAPEWITLLFQKCPNVIYHGEIDDAFEYMQQNAIMIAPLFSGSGMRVKIIEGMAHGKAIVTTTIGAEGINVSNGENIMIEDDENEFMLRIDELITDREKFNTIGSKAYEFVKTEL
jgi:polysaccharide biosynthesis protein PslH